MNLSDRLKEALQTPDTVFSFTLLGHKVPVTETVVITWVVMAVLIILAIFMRSRLETIPRGKQIWTEWAVDFCNNLCGEYFGKYSTIFSAYIGTIFLFIFGMNIIPIFSPISITLFGHHFAAPFDLRPPTSDINVPAALAIVTIVMVIVAGIAARGIKTWLREFIEPMPMMLPFNILDYITKPLSLCLRLFGNMLGAYIIMTMIEYAIPLLVPIPVSAYFDWFDGALQAMVFSFLTVIYLNMGMGIEAAA